MSFPTPSRFLRRFSCHQCSQIAHQRCPIVPTHTRDIFARYQHVAASQNAVPLRKQLKDESKRRKQIAKASKANNFDLTKNNRLKDWELTVGIEVHAELNTAHKLFSGAATSLNAEPNAHVAIFDAALPGAQPQFQRATLIPAIRAALAFVCEIQEKSSWDRKHYFYQDQPNGYQITQYYGKAEILRSSSME